MTLAKMQSLAMREIPSVRVGAWHMSSFTAAAGSLVSNLHFVFTVQKSKADQMIYLLETKRGGFKRGIQRQREKRIRKTRVDPAQQDETHN